MTQVICCTCLEKPTPDITYYTLDSNLDVSNELSLKEKILYCIPEFENILDGYDENGWICSICCEALCWSYNFRKMCLEVKSQLESAVNFKEEAIDIHEMDLTGHDVIKTEVFIEGDSKNNSLIENEKRIPSKVQFEGDEIEKSFIVENGRPNETVNFLEESTCSVKEKPLETTESQWFDNSDKMEEDTENLLENICPKDKTKKDFFPNGKITQSVSTNNVNENRETEQQSSKTYLEFTRSQLSEKQIGNSEEKSENLLDENICPNVKSTPEMKRKPGRPRKKIGFFPNGRQVENGEANTENLLENICPKVQSKPEKKRKRGRPRKKIGFFPSWMQVGSCEKNTKFFLENICPKVQNTLEIKRKRGRPKKQPGVFRTKEIIQPVSSENKHLLENSSSFVPEFSKIGDESISKNASECLSIEFKVQEIIDLTNKNPKVDGLKKKVSSCIISELSKSGDECTTKNTSERSSIEFKEQEEIDLTDKSTKVDGLKRKFSSSFVSELSKSEDESTIKNTSESRSSEFKEQEEIDLTVKSAKVGRLKRKVSSSFVSELSESADESTTKNTSKRRNSEFREQEEMDVTNNNTKVHGLKRKVSNFTSNENIGHKSKKRRRSSSAEKSIENELQIIKNFLIEQAEKQLGNDEEMADNLPEAVKNTKQRAQTNELRKSDKLKKRVGFFSNYDEPQPMSVKRTQDSSKRDSTVELSSWMVVQSPKTGREKLEESAFAVDKIKSFRLRLQKLEKSGDSKSQSSGNESKLPEESVNNSFPRENRNFEMKEKQKERISNEKTASSKGSHEIIRTNVSANGKVDDVTCDTSALKSVENTTQDLNTVSSDKHKRKQIKKKSTKKRIRRFNFPIYYRRHGKTKNKSTKVDEKQQECMKKKKSSYPETEMSNAMKTEKFNEEIACKNSDTCPIVEEEAITTKDLSVSATGEQIMREKTGQEPVLTTCESKKCDTDSRYELIIINDDRFESKMAENTTFSENFQKSGEYTKSDEHVEKTPKTNTDGNVRLKCCSVFKLNQLLKIQLELKEQLNDLQKKENFGRCNESEMVKTQLRLQQTLKELKLFEECKQSAMEGEGGRENVARWRVLPTETISVGDVPKETSQNDTHLIDKEMESDSQNVETESTTGNEFDDLVLRYENDMVISDVEEN